MALAGKECGWTAGVARRVAGSVLADTHERAFRDNPPVHNPLHWPRVAGSCHVWDRAGHVFRRNLYRFPAVALRFPAVAPRFPAVALRFPAAALRFRATRRVRGVPAPHARAALPAAVPARASKAALAAEPAIL